MQALLFYGFVLFAIAFACLVIGAGVTLTDRDKHPEDYEDYENEFRD